MGDFLVFTLSGPMGSFGRHAGHQRRGTERTPGRSAILGLLAAALGVERDRDGDWQALRAYGVAVRPLTRGAPLRDYHTAQTVPARVRRPRSRRAAVGAAGRTIHTLVTRRDYRMDVAVAVAVWGGAEARWPLPALARALQAPVFVLYLGRKSCPPAAPLAPAIVRAADPVAALRALEAPAFLGATEPGAVASDPFPGGRPDRIAFAPVEPLDRVRWHFGRREVWYFERGPGA